MLAGTVTRTCRRCGFTLPTTAFRRGFYIQGQFLTYAPNCRDCSGLEEIALAYCNAVLRRIAVEALTTLGLTVAAGCVDRSGPFDYWPSLGQAYRQQAIAVEQRYPVGLPEQRGST